MRYWLLLALTTAPACAAETILFDTDSGFFNDDGAALVMVLRSPRKVSVAGITVVPGNVWPAEGVAYMSQILGLLDRAQVPVYAGAQEPLLHTAAMMKSEGPLEYTGAFAKPRGAWSGAPKQNAVDFMIETIERHPHEITVLALGPMTNLAIAIRLRPDIQTKIRRLVWMGGNVRVPGNASRAAEFNFWFDPEAARIVLRSAIPEKVMFGLDICNRAKITKQHFDQIIAAKTPITERYKEDSGNRYPGFFKDPKATGYLWDELAAAWLLDPGFVTKSETMYLDVDSRFGGGYGATVPLDRKLAPEATAVRVMLELNFARLFALYKDLLTRRGPVN